MKKIFTALFAVLIVAAATVTLAACGGDDDNDQPTTYKSGVLTFYYGTTADEVDIADISFVINGTAITTQKSDFQELSDSEISSETKSKGITKFYKKEIPVSSLPSTITVAATVKAKEDALTAEKYNIGYFIQASFKPSGSSTTVIEKTNGVVNTVKADKVASGFEVYNKYGSKTYTIQTTGKIASAN